MPSQETDKPYQTLCGDLLQLLQQLAADDESALTASARDDLETLRSTRASLEKLITPIEDAQSSGQHKSDFLHSLRNILNTIIGYSELLADELATAHAMQAVLQQLQNTCHAILQLDTANAAPLIKPGQLSPPSQHAGTILVVDDQPESRDILCRHLLRQGYQVCEAGMGREMFEQLAQHNIDLILLDLILPEMDGDELLQQLKKNDELRAIPVIVVSGSTDNQRVLKCIEAGAEDYLNKPFNPTLLQARIRAGVERKHWHDREKQYRLELERNQSFIRSVFGRYLSQEIVDTLLENPTGLDLGGSQRKVSVLMADIRGFTTIAEQLTPPRVVKLLNNYLGTMSDIIIAHGGTVDEFIGDAILAIFGAPVNHSDNTDRAIKAALQMQQAVAGINQLNQSADLPEITIGVSINTGNVVAGNIGSQQRAKYGVVGHTVNQTARIEDYCEADTILISESTLEDCQQLLSIGHSFSINAKGMFKAINVFELNGIEPQEEAQPTNHLAPAL